jgi:NAD-dependent deacetylase
MIEVASIIASTADIFLVVGTSLLVYPAAGLIDYVPDRVKKFVIDPKKPDILHVPNLEFIAEKASVGLARLKPRLIQENV